MVNFVFRTNFLIFALQSISVTHFASPRGAFGRPWKYYNIRGGILKVAVCREKKHDCFKNRREKTNV